MKYLIPLFILISLIGCFDDTEEPIQPWPNGVCRYTIDSSFSAGQIQMIRETVEYINAETYFKFLEDDNYDVRIVKSDRNHSQTGYKNYKYDVEIDDMTCLLHELGHVIGLKHEHQRPDRDNYIIINWENIIESEKYNFEKLTEDYFLYDYTKFDYDYNSVMHYYYREFSKNEFRTLDTKNNNLIGNINKYSIADIKKINDIYK